MATRQYDFITGPETSEIPSASTPTLDDDLITLGYADDTFTKLTSFATAVADIAALKAVTAGDRADNQCRMVDSLSRIYKFDSASAAAGDDNLVVTPSSGTGRWIKSVQAVNEGGTGASTAAGARVALLPSLGTNATKVLAVNVGETDAEWVAGASATLAQYNTDVGNSSNTRTPVNTALLADASMSVSSFTFVDGDVTVGSDSIAETGHGMTTGQTCYLTNSGGALPAGLSASTLYYVIRVDADNFKLATTHANAMNNVPIDITAAASGGTHTVNTGGIKLNPRSIYTNLAQPGFFAHKNGSDVTWNIAGSTPTLVTFTDVTTSPGFIRGGSSALSSSIYTVPTGAGGLWFINAQVTFYQAIASQVYRIFIYLNGTSIGNRVLERESTCATTSSGNDECATNITAPLVLADGDTVRVMCESTRNHSSGATATIKGGSRQTFFTMFKVS